LGLILYSVSHCSGDVTAYLTWFKANFTQNFYGFQYNATQLRTSFPDSIHGRTDEEIHSMMVSNMWRLGVLGAVPSLAAGLSFLTADPLQHHILGRRGAVAVSALLSTAATIGLMFTTQYQDVIALRAIIGLCLGAKASIIAPFLGELVPINFRGRCLATWYVHS
jgi:MFS family permease